MNCEPTKTPDDVDIVALRKKYRQERDKRLNPAAGSQYVRVPGEFHDIYATDRHKAVAAREPIAEEIDVAILGAGFGGIQAAHHLTRAGVSHFRNIDLAGDFGGVWYWNRYPGIQCDNDG
jgi:cyclohexanone monooxygenase